MTDELALLRATATLLATILERDDQIGLHLRDPVD